MDDLYQKIVSQRGDFEKWLTTIPGFGGYMEMSARRTAESKMREHIAGQLRPALDHFATAERDLLAAGDISPMEKTRSVKSKLDNLMRRIASDTPGYSGFFASVKITADDLQRVYAFDQAMESYVTDIKAKVADFATAVNSGGDIPAALRALEEAILEASQAYDLRDSVLQGLA